MNLISKDSPPGHPNPELVHDLFAKQATRHPENIAIEYGYNSISYSTLENRANKLSVAIRTKFPDDAIVGVSCTRNADLVIFVLAILKSGKAYLPL